ncbi:MAG: hypothetical protein ACK4TL_17810 [Hyphomicrobiaceae bacterium]
MLKKLIPAAAVGALALAAAFGSAEAAATKLVAPASSAEILPIQVRSDGSGTPRARSSTPRSSGPSRSAAPRRASPAPRAAPRRAAPRHAAPRRTTRPYRWTRDRRYRYYGPYFIVPFGYWLYDEHYCYDWRYGPRGWGYYWNYRRCPL